MPKYSYGFIREYSNKKLLDLAKSTKTRPRVYKGTGVPQIIKSEIAKRKKEGKMNKTAGKKRTSSNPFGIPRGLF